MKNKILSFPINMRPVSNQKASWNLPGFIAISALPLLVGCSTPPTTAASPPVMATSPSAAVVSPPVMNVTTPTAIASPPAAVVSSPAATIPGLSYQQFVDELVERMTAEVLSGDTTPCRRLIEQNPTHAKQFRSAIIEQLKDGSTPDGVRTFCIEAKAKIDETY
jgi:hypothetical protein